MKLNERLKLIRTTEGFTQVEFAKIIGISHDSGIRRIESGSQEPGASKIEAICLRFPEYALWLTTEQVQPPHQISPDLAKSNKDTNNASARAKVKL
ncbi:helix-turn-helix domain-containing protein [Bathymodiolus septemdierum thioautotrophic gill symbiont]|uniref:Phage repressor protein C n=1 Tax=endosymbiont of Bathymodiolus septemdierum str. Myojin knoll TaxID=1303921 RepID=A0A0N7KBC2_9GAMM|nr:helix-turn-helix transcriptional regulator [Bathymodiolus septemdierum thioautotrophic gill symbiont]BAS67607.1 phage repressor protein C [endosymbiont of Bathymodiolus septemdierum str. Myojin knoll]